MKINADQFNKKINGQEVVFGTIEDLKGNNSSMNSTGIRVGDVVTFPENIVPGSYPTRPLTGDAEADAKIPRVRGVLVQRNGEVDFFGTSCLAIRDQHNDPFSYTDGNNNVITPEFNKSMCLMYDTVERVEALKGKTITCKSYATIKQKKFQSEEVQDKRVPVIEFVD
ncbi:MAG: hypothetical protein J6V44_11610 [Methanobrevibacter sp.]|nr:hypothetical protein [Methanobrevibacter sp.]